MTVSNPFDNPFATAGGSGEKVITEENTGKLFLITPKEQIMDFDTVHGKKDPIMADVVILDRNGKEHKKYSETLIFATKIVGGLKRRIGAPMPVLGILMRGEAKKGQQAPWILETPTNPKDVKVAVDYWNSVQAENPFA